MVEFKNPNRSTFESVLLMLVFVAVFAFLVNSYAREQRVEREKALIYQLTLLRQGVATFNLVEKRLPKNLIELSTAVFKIPGDELNHRYVDRVNVNDQGKVIDPFGNAYSYNEGKGWVSSTTPKYLNW